jgi:signal transduction histidine kinase
MPNPSTPALTSEEHEHRLLSRARVRRILQATLIHDLKAPLNTAILILDLLGRSIAQDDLSSHDVRKRLRENVDEVRREIRRLSEALPGLPSLPDPGEEVPLSFDLLAALGEALHLLRQQIFLRSARVRRHFPQERIFVLGRPADLQHALVNLVLNALEAKLKGAQVDVRVERAGDLIRIRVEDDGPGIPAELGERVFEPRVTTRDGQDGLGLTVARSILREHGGTLQLLPRDGGGTVAAMELPAVAPPAAAESTTALLTTRSRAAGAAEGA